MARVKIKESSALPATPVFNNYDAFDALMATAGVDSQIRALAESEADPATLNKVLTESLVRAQQRWALGLHHLNHEAQLIEGPTPDIALLTDGQLTAQISAGSAAIANAYAPIQALDERGLSLWGALSEGHRVSAKLPVAQLKVIIEEARDFETHWQPMRGGLHSRAWRKNQQMFVEVARPASPEAALSDAAWDVITSIKDRVFQRELMRRSEEVGMLGALLAARHSTAKAALDRLPEAHFTVQAVVLVLEDTEARSAEAYRTQLKNAAAKLEEYQGLVTRQLSEVLRHGLTAR